MLRTMKYRKSVMYGVAFATFNVTFIVMIAFATPVTFFSSFHSEEGRLHLSDIKQWTFMVYMDGENNLESEAIKDMNWLEYIGSSADVNVVVQIDRISGYDDTNGDWTEARRYYITKDYDTDTISSSVVQVLGEVNMGDPATLLDFIEWGKTNYPANRYALVLWDHGSGVMWGPNLGGVCWDDTDGHDYLTLQELKSVFSYPTGYFELLAFDACLMGAVEVHYALKDYANVILASEEVEYGYPYFSIIDYLTTNPSCNEGDLGSSMVQQIADLYDYWGKEYAQATFDVIDSEFVLSLQSFFADFHSALDTQKALLVQARQQTLHFEVEEYVDLLHLAENVEALCSGSIVSSAQQLISNMSRLLVELETSNGLMAAGGLSIYFPEVYSQYYSNYETTEFATDFQWDEVLYKYYTGGDTLDVDDEFEENDDFDEASLITAGSYQNLVLNFTDYDFYNISLVAGEIITINLYFEHDDGDIDLYLVNQTQNTVVSSRSETDNENISYLAPTSGLYTIVVVPYTSQLYHSYSLDVTTDRDDVFENNDDWLNCEYINNNTLYIDLVCRDSDFYAFWATEGYLINITLWFNYAEGDLDLYLWDYVSEYVLTESTTATDYENILWYANYTGYYEFEVYNYTDNLNYSMSANVTNVDDSLEKSHGLPSNNYIDWATPIDADEDYFNLICMNDDYYNLTLNSGIWINITILFDTEKGDLDAVLYNVSSWTPFEYDVLVVSRSFSDNEYIFFEVITPGNYYLRIIDQEMNFNYSMSIHQTNLVRDDEFEENDWFDNATELSVGPLYQDLSALDWDTYKVEVNTTHEFTFTLNYNISQGNLDLYLIDYNETEDVGYILEVSSETTGTEQIIYTPQSDGWIFLLIYLDGINMGYNLSITAEYIPPPPPPPSPTDGNGGGDDNGGAVDDGETKESSLDASFIVNATRIIEGEYVNFTSSVINGTSPYTYNWNFGDGTSSSEANPIHQFTSEGTYNVTLTVTDAEGRTTTYSRIITVLHPDDETEPPPAIIGYDMFVLIGAILVSTLILAKSKHISMKK